MKEEVCGEGDKHNFERDAKISMPNRVLCNKRPNRIDDCMGNKKCVDKTTDNKRQTFPQKVTFKVKHVRCTGTNVYTVSSDTQTVFNQQ